MNGKSAFVVYAQSSQVSFVLPFDLAPGAGTLTLQYPARGSTSSSLQIQSYCPSISHGLGTGNPANPVVDFNRPNGTAGTSTNPALFGEVVTLFVAGLGATNPAVVPGQPLPPGAAAVIAPVTVTIRGVPVEKTLVAATPGAGGVWRGLYFVAFRTPNLPAGNYPIVITVGGVSSDSLIFPVGLGGLGLSQTGFTFQATEGGGTPPAETLQILWKQGSAVRGSGPMIIPRGLSVGVTEVTGCRGGSA